MGTPQRAQGMSLPVFMPDTAPALDSLNREPMDIGSTTSWPLWIAAKTERRDSQFNAGAKSRRTVGSLVPD